jgi:pimeloyl-ACP methyl ester carboxylesterase
VIRQQSASKRSIDKNVCVIPLILRSSPTILVADLAPQNPVVFCHGLMGFEAVNIYPLRVSHWRGIKEVLESNGVEVFFTQVPGTSGIEDRAKTLEEIISKAYAGRSVHLVGHSMVGVHSVF